MIYLGNGLYSDANYLEHHGIKGQEWGVRRGPPYPIQRFDKKVIYNAKNYKPTTNRPHSDYNLTKWGSNKDQNIYVENGLIHLKMLLKIMVRLLTERKKL